MNTPNVTKTEPQAAEDTFSLDGAQISFQAGDNILLAARRVGHYIPSLCWHPELRPHGSCKLCTVEIAGRLHSACTTPATAGLQVTSNSESLHKLRRELLQFLFVEGNHFCPSCEKSGNCQLQALAYEHEMLSGRHAHFYPQRRVDASHPDILLDFNRCIFCGLCTRASQQLDGKNVFALSGRGVHKVLAVNSDSGLLRDSNISPDDAAARICPVGVILPKRKGFATPIGERAFDQTTPQKMVEAGKAPTVTLIEHRE